MPLSCKAQVFSYSRYLQPLQGREQQLWSPDYVCGLWAERSLTNAHRTLTGE